MKESLIAGPDLCALLVLTQGNRLLAGEWGGKEVMELGEVQQKLWLQLMSLQVPLGRSASQPFYLHPACDPGQLWV